jgi:hypothetical protein
MASSAKTYASGLAGHKILPRPRRPKNQPLALLAIISSPRLVEQKLLPLPRWPQNPPPASPDKNSTSGLVGQKLRLRPHQPKDSSPCLVGQKIPPLAAPAKNVRPKIPR